MVMVRYLHAVRGRCLGANILHSKDIDDVEMMKMMRFIYVPTDCVGLTFYRVLCLSIERILVPLIGMQVRCFITS